MSTYRRRAHTRVVNGKSSMTPTVKDTMYGILVIVGALLFVLCLIGLAYT